MNGFNLIVSLDCLIITFEDYNKLPFFSLANNHIIKLNELELIYAEDLIELFKKDYTKWKR